MQPAPSVQQASRRAQEKIEVSVVMPCLNEEATVAQCVRSALAALEREGLCGEVIVVDNGSSDRSAERAREAGARVLFEATPGYGSAYLTGLKEAQGDYIIIGDSDGTYDFGDIPRLLEHLRNGSDMVIGSRLRGRIYRNAMPWLHRYLGVPVLTALLNLIAGTRLSDAHSGFRAFRRDAYQRMGLLADGMEFASEMLVKAAAAGLRITEVPIHYYPRQGRSKLRPFRDAYRHIRFLLLYSPFHLFFLPGALMLALGLVLLLALVWGPIRIGRFFADFHFMIVGALLAILGFQVLNLAVYADIYKRITGTASARPFFTKFLTAFTLERGLLSGMLIAALGLSLLGWVLYEWLVGGGGFDTHQRLRQAILGMTLLVLGVQTVFASALIGLLLGLPQAKQSEGVSSGAPETR